MRLTINFLLKHSRKNEAVSPIYARLTIQNRRMELATKLQVDPEIWDETTKRCIGKTTLAKSINRQLQQFEVKLRGIFSHLVALGDEFDVNDIKDEFLGVRKKQTGLLEVFTYYLETIEKGIGKGYAFRTLKHYRVTYKRVQLYIKSLKRNDYPISKVNYKFLNGFDVYLKANYPIIQNTVWNYHKHLRRVLNLGVSLEHISVNPYNRFKVKLEPTHREFITLKELGMIEKKKLNVVRLSAIRDAFVFACYTGLSYADISKLSEKHLRVDDNDKEWIIINRSKNNNRCMIPLFPNAKAIIEKYKDFPESMLKGRLLPILSNQRMNAYLKELADICGIDKDLSMHVARHTFATSVTLSNGVPIETVSKILGHTSLKTTQIYAKVIASKISSDMDDLQRKLNL
ncbi:site-specific integrase [Carboxylicivirga mesophila]|uniref:Site-specific integrase n=1 Tax=Carboxylicivirga mesophila TaxID=1166478 RepID=A0ABS5K4J7_9BACT|nr:site-specific integrase [Carboxylicivirga mesophila]MBS2209934.1 site-specific integrase [Carboxylicivirga mesophila]